MIKEFQDEYRWLSNFHPCQVSFAGVLYDYPENAYQAAKTNDIEERKQFENVTPWAAKRIGRESITVREDWDLVKYEIMKHIQEQKYMQQEFKDLLLDTGAFTEIREGNRWGDKYWGVCLKTNEGKNMLGRIIMEIRSDIYWASL